MKKNSGYWKGKTVLVTGATGFLGGWLCRELEKNSKIVGLSSTGSARAWKLHKISRKNRLLKADIADPKKILAVFRKTRPDACFHLAGLSSPSYCEQHPMEALEVNLFGSEAVLLACLEYHVPVILVSTANLYPKKGVFTERSPVRCADWYSFTKLSMEQLAFFLSQQGLNATVVRLATLYGPMDPSESRMVPKNILAALAGKKNRNNPEYQRDFLFVSDAVRGLLAAFPGKGRFRLYNLCSGKTYRGTTVAKAISSLAHHRSPRLNAIRNAALSNRKARLELGWKPRYSLEEGLRETLQWFEKNRVASK